MEYEIIPDNFINSLLVFVNRLRRRSSHLHREYEFVFVLDGELEIYADGSACVIKKGDAAVLNAWSSHSLQAAGDGATCVFVQSSFDMYSRIFPADKKICFTEACITEHLDTEGRAFIRSCFLSLAEAYFSRRPLYEFDCIDSLNHILKTVLLHVPYGYSDTTGGMAAREPRMQRIAEYIEQNCERKLLLSELAGRFGLSVSYLSHYISENMQMSFQDYLSLARFRRAKPLIRQTSLSLGEIALMCGFSDLRYMNRAFEEKLGMTAAQYRQTRCEPLRILPEEAEASEEYILSADESREYLRRQI